MKLFTIALLSACVLATPVMAAEESYGIWGCLAVTGNGKEMTQTYGQPSQSTAKAHAIEHCSTGGKGCHIVKCSDKAATSTQADVSLPRHQGYGAWFKPKK